MSMLELKYKVSQLSKREQAELQAYLVELRDTPARKKKRGRLLDRMTAVKKVGSAALTKNLGHR